MKIITIHKHDEQSHEDKQPSVLKTAADYISKNGNHFNKELLQYALSNMVNVDESDYKFNTTEVLDYITKNNLKLPSRSNMFDLTYTANMAYADFYPKLLYSKEQCIEYALAVANDIDGYEGIEFCRFIADIMGKHINIDWNNLMYV